MAEPIGAQAPVDLRAPEQDPWANVAVPQGWEPIAQVCRNVLAGLDELTTETVRCIETELPAYTKESSVPNADLHASVYRNLEMILIGMAERRDPHPEELEVRRELGHRRAMQGLPVDALLQAYHVGYRELWQALIGQTAGRAEASSLLLHATATIWGWIHQVTSAVAQAYQETSRGRELLAAGVRARFVEDVSSGDLQSEAVLEATRSMGFDPDGAFQAFCARPASMIGNEPARIQSSLAGLGPVVCIARGAELLVLSQGPHADAVIASIGSVSAGVPVGAGALRSGLAGARLSIGDAERALALSIRHDRPADFWDDWLPATMLRSKERLEDLLSPGTAVAESHPHLAEAVRAFGESGFSISEAARKLSLHPNTVVYRLDRWRALTGWDPRTYSGLTRSITSLDLRD